MLGGVEAVRPGLAGGRWGGGRGGGNTSIDVLCDVFVECLCVVQLRDVVEVVGRVKTDRPG